MGDNKGPAGSSAQLKSRPHAVLVARNLVELGAGEAQSSS